MADRFPLVVASNVVQELANADNLNLSGCGITNTTSITCNNILVQTGAISIASSAANDTSPGQANIAIGRSADTIIGIATGSHNIAIGFTTPSPSLGGYSNIILGHARSGAQLAGFSTYTGNPGGRSSAEFNVFIGRDAGGQVTTGSRNAFIGLGAGFGVTTGNHNYCVGEDTMSLKCDGAAGDSNICLGNQSGRNLTSGDNNVFIGINAGRANSGVGQSCIGDNNIAIGINAAINISTGSNNAILSVNAGYALTSGSNNTFLGQESGYAITNSNSNTAIGSSAGINITTGNNNTCLGAGSLVSIATTSNQVVLGNSGVTNLRCNVTTISAISDVRDKKDIVDLPIGLEFVNSLRPVKFEWNRRDGSMAGLKEAGFIAQELDAAQGSAGVEDYLRLVLKDNPDQLEASPGKLIPVLVKAIQELKAEIDELKASK